MTVLIPILFFLVISLGMMLISIYQSQFTLDSSSKPLTDKNLQSLFDRLGTPHGIDHIPVQIHQNPSINGMATPSGKIYLTQGFLNAHRQGKVTSEELVSVVAHEMGHVALGHAKKRIFAFALHNTAHLLLSQILNRIIPGLGMLLSSILQNIFSSHLSRKDEFEADAYASALMIKTGFDVNAQKTLLKKLKKLNPNDTKTPAWLLSHPPIEDRVHQIEQNVLNWTTTAKTYMKAKL